MQEIGVLILFLSALSYLASLIIKVFIPKKGSCNGGCSGCGGIDFNVIENKGIKKIKCQ